MFLLSQSHAQKIQNPELTNAAKMGDTTRMKELIAKDADVNIKDNDYNGYNSLMWASLRGHTNAVKLLIVNGAELNAVDVSNQSALALAAFSGRLEIVKLLVEKGAEINPKNPKAKTALASAVTQGNGDIAKYLLEKGAKMGPDILADALQYPAKAKPDMIQLLILNGANVNAKSSQSLGGTTALIWAVDKDYIDIVKLAIQKKADMNIFDKNGMTALMVAVKQGKVEMTKLLIENGANLNSIGGQGSALMIATEKGNTEFVNLLIEKGADVNLAKQWGETALIIAVEKDNLAMAELLINKGANVDAKKGNGETSLMRAANYCKIDMVKLLISKKADANVIDKNGQTALNKAKCSEVLNLLESTGARVASSGESIYASSSIHVDSKVFNATTYFYFDKGFVKIDCPKCWDNYIITKTLQIDSTYKNSYSSGVNVIVMLVTDTSKTNKIKILDFISSQSEIELVGSDDKRWKYKGLTTLNKDAYEMKMSEAKKTK